MEIGKLDREYIKKKLREDLSKFPLYSSEHWVLVHFTDSIHISYSESSNRDISREKTRFDIQISGGVCYILSFFIETDKRKRGNGTCLLSLLENFCIKNLEVRQFQVTPSGISKDEGFYEHRGYKPLNESELIKFYKRINQSPF
jgi:hypothetical protein